MVAIGLCDTCTCCSYTMQFSRFSLQTMQLSLVLISMNKLPLEILSSKSAALVRWEGRGEIPGDFGCGVLWGNSQARLASVTQKALFA